MPERLQEAGGRVTPGAVTEESIDTDPIDLTKFVDTYPLAWSTVVNRYEKDMPLVLIRRITMSKERNSRKEALKKPSMTLKEKRAAKKAKKGGSAPLISSDKK
ncbi:MAG: hypothetical protein DRQ58_04400 [Gammaproteobacteria bacterium]|nr:MAG: hypothetical protein DRQ58_04400 [Gammaproteobacteria bacterium]